MSVRALPYVLIIAVIATLAATPADAQLVVVDRRYKVTAIQPDRGVIKVSPADKDGTAADVLVDGNTKMYVLDKQVPSFSWKLLQKGMKITVHGGATWDLKVRAKKIFLWGG
ncbi:MAG: hypothetical protein FJX76_00140 [Armatimonadetes bacterium]|nr:hypothetical protein [Armatimonadota bacterium]